MHTPAEVYSRQQWSLLNYVCTADCHSDASQKQWTLLDNDNQCLTLSMTATDLFHAGLCRLCTAHETYITEDNLHEMGKQKGTRYGNGS